jgi:ADP-heptose:LPS heptosyltransferase
MPIQIRSISLALRQRHSAKDRRRVLRLFEEWRTAQEQLAPAEPRDKKLLIIRLDDIGDYVVFRNQLQAYKRSPRWQDHHITLLANASWKAIFALLDEDTVDDTIWVEKNRYLEHADYRWTIWQQLRAQGFETVIAPSRTRPLLLDDCCMLAAAPNKHIIGCVNTYRHAEWNALSDALYKELFTPSDPLIHEFRFNAEFTAKVCAVPSVYSRPTIEQRFASPSPDAYVLCFLGANTRSKRWPVGRWIEFIELYRRRHSTTVVVAGASRAELDMARLIQERTGAVSIAGKVSVAEFIPWVAGAQAVISNDTMAAHLAVSFGRPTVIVANGVTYMRFTEYGNTGVDYAATVYPDVFARRRRRVGEGSYDYIQALTSDIASIKATTVLGELERVAYGPGSRERSATVVA